MADKFVKIPQLTRAMNALKSIFVKQEAGKGLSTEDYTTAEKEKLAGIADGSNKYVLPTATSETLGGVKVGANMKITDGVLTANLDDYQKSADADKKYETKSDAQTAYAAKVDKVEGKQLSTNDYTTAEKDKLSGVEENANNYTLPNATKTVTGGVKIGDNITVGEDGTISVEKPDLTPYAKSADVANTYATKTSLNDYATVKSLESYAKKSDVASAVIYKGSVDTYSDLPKTGMLVGWMYNITNADAEHGISAGDNVVYNGKDWDNYNGTIVIDAATDEDIDAIFKDY